MRYLIATAAAGAVTGFLALTPVRAEPTHYLGAEIQSGNQCWVSTSSNDQGYWRDCPKLGRAMKKKK
ncbi:MAG TPA: hypothetical protein VGM57_01080 [Pseudolabrys sp.]|jgi:hypothetical protein